MSTATAEHSESTLFPIALFRSVLVLLGIACVYAFWQANAQTDDYRLRYPVFAPWLWNLYLTFYLGSVVSFIAMWNWRMWGLWLFAAISVAMLFTEFYAMGFTWSALRIPAAFAAVWFAAQPVWNRWT